MRDGARNPSPVADLRRQIMIWTSRMRHIKLFSKGPYGKIAENRTLTAVNRRYFGICGRFSAVNRH